MHEKHFYFLTISATGIGLQRNLFIVFPRLCKTDLTQIAIARSSDIFRRRIVFFLTFLIHEHNRFAFCEERIVLL
jgi:hypothetical protein